MASSQLNSCNELEVFRNGALHGWFKFLQYGSVLEFYNVKYNMFPSRHNIWEYKFMVGFRPWNKDFQARHNSDLILQKVVPGLCFYTQFCDRPGRNEQLYGFNEQLYGHKFALLRTLLSRPGGFSLPRILKDFRVTVCHCFKHPI